MRRLLPLTSFFMACLLYPCDMEKVQCGGNCMVDWVFLLAKPVSQRVDIFLFTCLTLMHSDFSIELRLVKGLMPNYFDALQINFRLISSRDARPKKNRRGKL